MNLGSSQVDITPRPGINLAGFAARIQPSTGVLDPLFCRALYLADGDEKLLWLHCDLIGFNGAIVVDFRRWAAKALGLDAGHIMLSGTHTHSGPCTIHLQEASGYDTNYVGWLADPSSTGGEIRPGWHGTGGRRIRRGPAEFGG